MAEASTGGWGRFPRSLLGSLREAAPEGAVLKLGLWNGETVVLRRVVSESEDGLLGEVEPPAAAMDGGTAVVAVPWQAIARIEASERGGRRARPGFRPGEG